MALIFSNHDLRHLPGKASRLTEVLTEGIGSIEGGVEEENYKGQKIYKFKGFNLFLN